MGVAVVVVVVAVLVITNSSRRRRPRSRSRSRRREGANVPGFRAPVFDWGRGRSRGSPPSGKCGLAVAAVQGAKEQMCQVFGHM